MNFNKIIRYSQYKLKNALETSLKAQNYTPINKDGFLYAKGEIPVLLIAHLDTVHKERAKDIYRLKSNGFIMSPQGIGGDDRCGIYMIMEIIKTHRCSVLFCEDEEIGGIGARKFLKSKIPINVNYMIEFDRMGRNDAVFYDCENLEFTDFICKNGGFKENFGTFSDISLLAPSLGIAAVNISSGYYKAHTLMEYIDMSIVKNNIERVKEIISIPSVRFEYVESKRWYYDCTFDYDSEYSTSFKNKNSTTFYHTDSIIYVAPLDRNEYIITLDGQMFELTCGYYFIGSNNKCYMTGDNEGSVVEIKGSIYTENGNHRGWTSLDYDKSYFVQVEQDVIYL